MLVQEASAQVNDGTARIKVNVAKPPIDDVSFGERLGRRTVHVAGQCIDYRVGQELDCEEIRRCSRCGDVLGAIAP